MLPTIAPGVEVVLDCGKDWQIGDIIAYVDSGHLGVHRIMDASADRRWLLTRGDNNFLPDDPFEANDAIIGVITRVRAAEDWVEPVPLAKSWLRERILQYSARRFHADAESFKKHLRGLQRIAWFFRLGPRIAGRLRRLIGRKA